MLEEDKSRFIIKAGSIFEFSRSTLNGAPVALHRNEAVEPFKVEREMYGV